MKWEQYPVVSIQCDISPPPSQPNIQSYTLSTRWLDANTPCNLQLFRALFLGIDSTSASTLLTALRFRCTNKHHASAFYPLFNPSSLRINKRLRAITPRGSLFLNTNTDGFIRNTTSMSSRIRRVVLGGRSSRRWGNMRIGSRWALICSISVSGIVQYLSLSLFFFGAVGSQTYESAYLRTEVKLPANRDCRFPLSWTASRWSCPSSSWRLPRPRLVSASRESWFSEPYTRGTCMTIVSTNGDWRCLSSLSLGKAHFTEHIVEEEHGGCRGSPTAYAAEDHYYPK